MSLQGRNQLRVIISRASVRILHAWVLWSILITAAIGVGTVSASVEDLLPASTTDQAAYRPAALSDPEPKVEEQSAASGQSASTISSQNSAVIFIENVGQFDSEVRFQTWGTSPTLYLREDSIWLTISEPPSQINKADPDLFDQDLPGTDQPRKGSNVKINFPGSNPHPRLEPFNLVNLPITFFGGPGAGASYVNVPAWKGVRYVDIYPGADLEIVGMGSSVSWSIIVRDEVRFLATGNHITANGLRIHLAGQKNLLLSNKSLRVSTDVRDFSIPEISIVGLTDPDFSKQPSLTDDELWLISPPTAATPEANHGPGVRASIPPVFRPYDLNDSLLSSLTTADGLVYSTYLGGSDWEIGKAIAVDSSGAAYVTGYGSIFTAPSVPGTIDATGNADVFVIKLSPSGNQPEYLSFIGGSGYDESRGIAIDGLGKVYVTGFTQSNNFPITPGAFDTSFAGSQDVFVFKLSSSGTALEFSSYIGGTGGDQGEAIVVDAASAIYLTGNTGSSNFPTTPGAFRTTQFAGTRDAFVVKLNPSGQVLDYSTFLGGSADDSAAGIDIDSQGNAYVAGSTTSSNFPTTANAYDLTRSGTEAFVTKLNPLGTSLMYSTFLGGTLSDSAFSLAVGSDGSAYVGGGTRSTDFPFTPNAVQVTKNAGGDGFVAMLSPDGSGLSYSTFLGGNDTGDNLVEVSVDDQGSIYVVGSTYSTDFPVTEDAYDAVPDPGYSDLFITKIGPSGSLAYSSYFGSPIREDVYGSAIDGSGNVYATGITLSTQFPITPGSYSPTFNGFQDAFVFKLSTGSGCSTAALSPAAQAILAQVEEQENCGNRYDQLIRPYRK